jgi:hypothetical protein
MWSLEERFFGNGLDHSLSRRLEVEDRLKHQL